MIYGLILKVKSKFLFDNLNFCNPKRTFLSQHYFGRKIKYHVKNFHACITLYTHRDSSICNAHPQVHRCIAQLNDYQTLIKTSSIPMHSVPQSLQHHLQLSIRIANVQLIWYARPVVQFKTSFDNLWLGI